MIIRLNTASTVPIYVQLRNQIVTGIGRGELKVGEKFPRYVSWPSMRASTP